MPNVTPTHVISGIGGVMGGNSVVDQLTAILIGHGTEATLAHNEAGLAVTVVATIGAMLWQWLRTKEPVALAGELASFEPDYDHEAAMMTAAVDKVLAARQIPQEPTTATTVAAPPVQPAPAAPTTEPPASPPLQT